MSLKAPPPTAAKSAAQEQFAGEPKFTADVHFLAGQVHESKISAPTPNGHPQPAAEVRRHQSDALNQYAAALKLDPKHTPSLYRSAIVFGDMKRHDQAIGMWQRYVDAVGRTPDSLVNLGIACEMADRAADAEAAYREATRRDPAHAVRGATGRGRRRPPVDRADAGRRGDPPRVA